MQIIGYSGQNAVYADLSIIRREAQLDGIPFGSLDREVFIHWMKTAHGVTYSYADMVHSALNPVPAV